MRALFTVLTFGRQTYLTVRPIQTSAVLFRRMPPKKVIKEEKILLGRPGNNLKIGVVGLPNVG